MKKTLLLIGLLATLSIANAAAYNHYGTGTYSRALFDTYRPVQGSAVYNARRGIQGGFNPYYMRGTPSTYRNQYEPRSHIFLRNSLDYQVYRNPELLTPRMNTNNHRYLRGMQPGQFERYNSRGFTGRIRTHYYSNLH